MPGRHGAADVAARARAVVHDDRLTQLRGQRLADDAGQDVGGAAGGKGHDDGDGLARVGLGHGCCMGQQACAENGSRGDRTQGKPASGVEMWHGCLLQGWG